LEEDQNLEEENVEEFNRFFNQGKGQSVLVLMVAEKPSIAKSISEALSNNRYKSRKGVSKFCPVNEFSGAIFGYNAWFRVTSVAGHVYSTDFPREYQDWKKHDPADLF